MLCAGNWEFSTSPAQGMSSVVLHHGVSQWCFFGLELATVSVFQSPAHLLSHLVPLGKEQMLVDVSDCIPLGNSLFSSIFLCSALKLLKGDLFSVCTYHDLIGKHSYVKGPNIEKT